MHLEIVGATNTNKQYVIKVGYYSGPWPTPEPDRGGNRKHFELQEEGWTTYFIRRDDLLTQVNPTHTHKRKISLIPKESNTINPLHVHTHTQIHKVNKHRRKERHPELHQGHLTSTVC